MISWDRVLEQLLAMTAVICLTILAADTHHLARQAPNGGPNVPEASRCSTR